MAKPEKLLTQEQLAKVFLKFKTQGLVEYDDVVLSLQDELKNSESFIEEERLKTSLTDEQKDKLAKAVFFDPEVLKQLEESENSDENDAVKNFDDYLKYKNEVFRQNGK